MIIELTPAGSSSTHVHFSIGEVEDEGYIKLSMSRARWEAMQSPESITIDLEGE